MTPHAATTEPHPARSTSPRDATRSRTGNIFSASEPRLALPVGSIHVPVRAFPILFALILMPVAAQQPPAPTRAGQPTPPSTQPLGTPGSTPSPLAEPTVPPAVLFLFELERRFAADVALGGGKAFATWFADDAVTLNNGQPAILGRGNIAAATTWSPSGYQLSWTPEGGQMLPSNDAGYTWGRYEGRSRDRNGEPVVTTGRYITLWKKTPAGIWKVALDASANEPPEKGACCTLPKP